LRGRLTLSIAAILLLALIATFVAAYRGTGSDLRNGIDDELQREARSISSRLFGVPPRGPAATLSQARRLLQAQPFGPSARLISISVPGAGLVSTEPDIQRLGGGAPPPESEEEEGGETEGERHEEGEVRDLLTAGSGYSTIQLEDAGDIRLFTEEVVADGRTIATVRVGESLEPVDRALEGLGETFLLVGGIALLIGAAASYLLAAQTARPLRSMASSAEEIDAGDLSRRMEVSGSADEVARLAESFNRMLARLDDAFSRQREFVADASHELRTPLTVIRGQLEVLSRQSDPKKQDVDHVAEQVQGAVARMQSLVDDLLLLAEADQDLEVRRQTVSLRGYLEDQLDGFRAAAQRRFEVGEVPDGSFELDPERIGQVIWNLLSNAVDHTAEGGRICVSAAAVRDGVVIRVDDDGPGIPAAERERIFDRFHRTDYSRDRRAGGSGLGLAIARALVEAHGGWIRTAKSPLGGARIEFLIARPPA
jgi:two-component system, OmpR family, sensor kinase